MAILVNDSCLMPLNPPPLTPQCVFERLVKSYYCVKFQDSSSKIEWVMAILVHHPLLRP